MGQMAYLVGNGGLNWISWTSFSSLGVVVGMSLSSPGDAGTLNVSRTICSIRSGLGAAAAPGVVIDSGLMSFTPYLTQRRVQR